MIGMYKFYIKNKKLTNEGVSEIIGTILLVTITVVIASILIVWVQSTPAPMSKRHVAFTSKLDLNATDTGATVKIVHNGGEMLEDGTTIIYVIIDDKSNKLTIKDGLNGSTKWSIGQTWSYYNANITSNSSVAFSIIDISTNELLISDTIQTGASTVRTLLMAAVYSDPSSVPADNNTPFKMRVYVTYAGGVTPINANVTADLTAIGGNSSVALTYNATSGLYECALLTVPTNVSTGTYKINTTATASGSTAVSSSALTVLPRAITSSSYITPSTVASDNTTTFRVYASVSYTSDGISTNANVTANLSSVGGSDAVTLTYNATSRLYESALLVVPFNVPVGMYQINITAALGGASSATSSVLIIASSPIPVTTTTYTPASSYSVINSTLSSLSSSQNWTDSGAYSTISENYSTSALANQSMFAYASAAIQTPFYRTWNGTSWSAPLAALDIGGGVNVIEWIVLKGNPVRNEFLLATMGKDGRVVAQVYNGSTCTWGNLKIIATAIGSNYERRGFDIAYETISGRALVVSQNNTGNPMQYIWNGNTSSWSGPTTIDLASADVIRWIRMDSNPLSNEVAMTAMNMTSSSTGGARGIIWNGSAWTNLKILTTATGNYKAESTGVSYEALSGRVMFTWGENATEVYYWLYNGSAGSWVGASKTLLTIQWQNKTTDWLMLKPDHTSNKMILGVQDGSRELDTRLWSGSSWDTIVQHPRHDATTQSSGGRNFDIAFMYTGNGSGRAWLMWGSNQGAGQQIIYAVQWNGTAWGTRFVLAESDASDVVYLKSTVGGILYAGIFEDTASTLDDFWESRITASANWTARMLIETDVPTANQPSMCHPFMIAAGTNNSVTPNANTTAPMTLQFNITSIPQNQDSYFLQFNANPNGSTFYVYVFNGTIWNLRKTVSDSTMTLYNYALLPSEIIGDTVYVMFVGASNNKIPVSIYFDYVRVKSTFTG